MMHDLPRELRNYWSFRDDLAVETGVIFKGHQIVIPPKMRNNILQTLHIGHQGIEKTRSLARQSVYWININRDIEVMCKDCQTCQEMMEVSVNHKEPLLAHKLPSEAWQFIVSDIFEIRETKFLLTVDR